MIESEIEMLQNDQFNFVAMQTARGQAQDEAVSEYQRQIYGLARDLSSRDITSMPWLPQLPEIWAQEIHDEIESYERQFASPNLLIDEYLNGVAEHPDQFKEVKKEDEPNPIIFTAEHATNTVRKATGKLGYPDVGTAGLAAALAIRYGVGLIMVGRQTGNAATDEDHPIKPLISQYLSDAHGFLSVHGMGYGKFINASDRTEIQAVMGLGIDPSEELYDFAVDIKRMAKEALGLYVTIGNDDYFYEQKPNSIEPKISEKDGNLYQSRLAALNPNSTTNFVHGKLNVYGYVPAFQIEITNLLRLTPEDKYPKDRVSKVIGVAMGYKLLESIVKSIKLK